MGVNLEGATQTAIRSGTTLAASRLEAPEIPPGITVDVAALPWAPLRWSGVQRRMVFDFRDTPFARRSVPLRLLSGTTTPPFRTTAPIDVFVVGGDLSVGDRTADRAAAWGSKTVCGSRPRPPSARPRSSGPRADAARRAPAAPHGLRGAQDRPHVVLAGLTSRPASGQKGPARPSARLSARSPGPAAARPRPA